MRIVKNINEMSSLSLRFKRQGLSIGFVPTMGYLHDGHISLIKKSKLENDITTISIFVNPLQFSPKEDLKKYPRDFKRDEKLARANGVDFLFYPSVKQIYPKVFLTSINVDGITRMMCGRSRPDHFQGVATIVSKLFNIVQPTTAYFGQKDFQQAIVIKKMIEDLNFKLKLKIMPVVREKDGLAMSSRNKNLKRNQRRDALILNQSLKLAKKLISDGESDPKKIISTIKNLINSKKTAKIDYVVCVDPTSLASVKSINKKILIALAVKIGNTRLIDNTFAK